MSTARARIVIITGGDLLIEPAVEDADFVIAVDSGYDHAMARAIHVDLLVGDMDSITPGGRDHAVACGVVIEEYPGDKNETDLEIAIGAAVSRGATSIDIYGGEGGRLGHLLGIALSTAGPKWHSANLTWHTRTGSLRTATPGRPVTLPTSVGEIVTLLPVGDVHGVTATGVRWPLTDASLTLGTTRGVSNEATQAYVTIEVGDGTLLVIQEGPSIP
ncbi:MAG: thiamine diphosphokinase [Actinomycetota bacterium]|nr:thiamine diphosphokinase [Actinomycetota bacterium]